MPTRMAYLTCDKILTMSIMSIRYSSSCSVCYIIIALFAFTFAGAVAPDENCESSPCSKETVSNMEYDSIKDYLNPQLFEDPSTMEEIGLKLREGQLVVIKDAFVNEFADALHEELLDMPFTRTGKYFPDGFHYRYRTAAHSNLTSSLFNQTFHLFNSDATKKFASEFSGRDTFGPVSASASHYGAGDYSLPNSDWLKLRTVSFQWHLSKNWLPEWGGAFFWCPEEDDGFIQASFNTLVLFSVRAGVSHHVTTVTNHAQEKRLTFDGWWNSGWEPSIENIEERMDTPEKRRDVLHLEAIQYNSIVDKAADVDEGRRKRFEEFLELWNKESYPDTDIIHTVDFGNTRSTDDGECSQERTVDCKEIPDLVLDSCVGASDACNETVNLSQALSDNKDDNLKDYMNPQLFEDPKVMEEIGRKLRDGKLVVLKDALLPAFAERMHQELLQTSFTLNEEVFDDGFHYKHNNVYGSGHFSNFGENVFSLFDSDSTKQFISDLSGRDTFGEASLGASHYMATHHSLPHTDCVKDRTVAFVWHLSKNWRPEWGGALHWSQERFPLNYVHASFNSLTLFSVSHHTMHHVTTVSSHAIEKRLTVNGWWNDEWTPSIDDDLEEEMNTPEKRKQFTTSQMEELDDIIFEEMSDLDEERKARLSKLYYLQQEENFPPSSILLVELCVDKHEDCEEWAVDDNQCTENPEWMLPNCPGSCGVCSKGSGKRGRRLQ